MCAGYQCFNSRYISSEAEQIAKMESTWTIAWNDLLYINAVYFHVILTGIVFYFEILKVFFLSFDYSFIHDEYALFMYRQFLHTIIMFRRELRILEVQVSKLVPFNKSTTSE